MEHLPRDIQNLVYGLMDPDDRVYCTRSWEKISNNCCYAAQNGFLDPLKWSRAQNYPWNEDTCTIAVEGGHLEVLPRPWMCLERISHLPVRLPNNQQSRVVLEQFVLGTDPSRPPQPVTCEDKIVQCCINDVWYQK